jgi:hypothetical protein
MRTPALGPGRGLSIGRTGADGAAAAAQELASFPIANQVGVTLADERLLVFRASKRGRQTVNYPTKKATIKGGRRFIAGPI